MNISKDISKEAPTESCPINDTLIIEYRVSGKLFRRLQSALDRYPSLSSDALVGEAIACYLSLLEAAEEWKFPETMVQSCEGWKFSETVIESYEDWKFSETVIQP
jgi:hypothetical protein